MNPVHAHRLHSLPQKLLVAIILWLLGALFFVGLTLNITWRLEDRGVAINEAGSLRKQSYLMLAMVQSHNSQTLATEIKLFEDKLDNLSRLQSRSLWFETRSNHLVQLQSVAQQFARFKLKILSAQIDPASQPNLLHDTHMFIGHIDELVKSIETENTHSIQIMRVAQGLLMVMVMVSALLSLFLLNKLVIRPLSLLNQGIQKITDGQLDTRVHIATHDEFHQVSDGFNQMAKSLQDAYQHLEDKVAQKTADLARTNQELSTLYEITAFLHKAPLNQESMHLFLSQVMLLAKAPSGSIRLLNQEGEQMKLSAHINLPAALVHHKACLGAHACLCGEVAFEPDFAIYPLNQEHRQLLCQRLGVSHLAIYPLQLRDQTLGILTLYFNDEHSDDGVEMPLIKLLCSQLAVSIENARLNLRDKQYAVLEERNIMAQGLHDSIAQSLSFLNLQLQMLDQALKKNQHRKIEQHLAFLNTGVQQCYDDVRELLTNFRLKLTQESFHHVLTSVVERFKAQVPIDVTLQFSSNGPDLSPQQQLQLVFIVQEALSNIRKHAQASTVAIVFNNASDQITLSIQDNGIGFDTHINKEYQGHHIGLAIMQERIAQVQGQIRIDSSLGHGTLIQVTIAHHLI